MNIGFIVNPIAGMGGKVALKGTDGVLDEAIEKGAEPVAWKRADKFLKTLENKDLPELTLIPGPGPLGQNLLNNKDLEYEIIFDKDFNWENYGDFDLPKTSSDDTIEFVERIKDKIDLLVFVGGDGTARDVHGVIGKEVPILGVPSGVKVYSSVFGSSPRKAANILAKFLVGDIPTKELEIVDINEEKFRADDFVLEIYGYCPVPFNPQEIPGSKQGIKLNDTKEKEMISLRIREEIKDNEIYIFGPGTTVGEIEKDIGINPTLLGIDLGEFSNGELKSCHLDLKETDLLNLINKEKMVKILISPIGGQGYIFGRGNQQISPSVIKKIGKQNIKIVSTINKLQTIDGLRIDTGDEDVDSMFNYAEVIVGYHDSKMKKVI